MHCAELIRHEKSQDGEALATVAETVGREAKTGISEAPTTAEDAVRLAIKLAVEVGDYELASALLDVAKRAAPKIATDAPLELARRGRP